MQCGLFLDVVVSKGSAVFQLFTGKDKSLLIWWNSFFILDLGLDVLDAVSWFNVQSDGLSSESLHEDLHTTSESQDEMEGGFLLDIVVGKGSAVLELFTSEDESLLVGWNTFLVLDLGLDVLDAVSWLDIESDSLSCECFDEDLH